MSNLRSYYLDLDFPVLQKVPLKALEIELERRGGVFVTRETIESLVKHSQESSMLEARLRKVASLRIVSEWPNWKGKLVRRWISQVEHSLSLFRNPNPDPNPGNRK